MQRYELVEGSSSKFWEAQVTGSDLTVRFGRIGTEGQAKSKAFASTALAQKEYEKLVREKTGKGYLPVGTGLRCERPHPSPPPEGEGAKPAEQAAVREEAAGFPQPTGGLRWTAAWTAQLPPFRGLHAPPLPATPVPVATHAEELFQRGACSRDHAAALLAADVLQRRSVEAWSPLVLLAHRRLHGPAWPLALCLQQHDAAFALELAFAVIEPILASDYPWRVPELVAPLRQHIAACSDAEHDALVAQASAARAGDPARLLAAHLFPHRDGAAEFVGPGLPPAHLELLWTCALPPGTFLAQVRNVDYGLTSDALHAGLLLQFRLHGDAAFDAFVLLHERSLHDKNYNTSVPRGKALLGAVRTPGILPCLLQRLQDRVARDALDQLAGEFPAAAIAAALERASRAGDPAALAWALRIAQASPAAVGPALANVSAAARARFEAAQAERDKPEAKPDELPAVLRDPPWLRTTRTALPVLDVDPLPTPEVLAAPASRMPGRRWGDRLDAFGFAECFGLTAEGAQALSAGRPLPPEGLKEWHGREASISNLFANPRASWLPLWNSYPAKHWSAYEDDDAICHLFRECGFAAVPGLVAYFREFPKHAVRIAEAFDTPQLVDWALQATAKGGLARDAAERWLRRYPGTVLQRALPAAFAAEASPGRDAARRAIRWLAEGGELGRLRSIAARYGPAMAAAVETFLALDATELLPAKIPPLPAFYTPAAFRRPELPDGRVLPAAALQHVGTMLALSAPGAPYAGIAVLRAHCTRESLAGFAWDLLEAWVAAGAPARESWALHALGLLGDDGTARRLAPRIREWAEHGAPSRALAALDQLAAIGSDVALLQLHGFTRQNKLKPVQKRARELVTQVAEARGLTEEELADRMVPTFGLDEAGALQIDFGPRQFRLRFDEALTPWLQDAAGERLKAIPRPNRNDDAARAQAAIEHYKALCKDVEATGKLQVARLEQAMVRQRRWSAADWRVFFLDHPLMRHLAARLVWGVFEGELVTAAFRIAEDGTLADATDSTWALPDGARVGLPHALELALSLHDAFTQVFADYEIAQPFRQLGRETFALEAAERAGSALQRFAGRRVATASVLSLGHRGWQRFQGDGMFVTSYARPCGEGLMAELPVEPGVPVSDAKSEPVQALGALRVYEQAEGSRWRAVPLARLSALEASEVLRDIALLAPAKE